MSESKPHIFIDYSGSTGHSDRYWDNVKTIVDRFKDNSTITFWDSEKPQTVSYDNALKIIEEREGNCGTTPSLIAPLTVPDSYVILVTDGQVANSEVKRCDEILNSRSFEKVEVHFLSSCGGGMNLSVSAPFTRKTNYEIYIDKKLHAAGSSKEVIDLKKYYNNLVLFKEEAKDLLTKITMQNLGKENLQLRDDLLDLQKNLLNCISKSQNKIDFDKIRRVLSSEKGTEEEAIKCIIDDVIPNAASEKETKEIQSLCKEMIDKCTGCFDFSFNVISRVRRAGIVEEELPESVECSKLFECPISLDVDIPCCLIKEGDPIFKGFKQKQINDFVNNPLSVLFNTKLVKMIKRRIDHLVGLNTLKEMWERNEKKSPFTRSKVSCALCFGSDKTHIEANRFSIANIFFGEKIVGNDVLWLFVMYFIIKEIDWLKNEEGFMTIFKDYLKFSVKKKFTNITLTGLPIDPLIKAPIDIAIWYCVMSPFIYDSSIQHNRLRVFGRTAKFLIEILALLKLKHKPDWAKRQVNRYYAFKWMSQEARKSKPIQWKEMIKAQYQNHFITKDKRIVLLDGPRKNNNNKMEEEEGEEKEKDIIELPYLRTIPFPEIVLTNEELNYLSTLVDRNKTVNNVDIPNTFPDLQPITPEVNYQYGLDYKNDIKIEIDPKTLYPIKKIGDKTWKDCSEEKFGPLSKQLSLHQYYVRFVCDKLKYPSIDDLLWYVIEKQNNKKIYTLPVQIMEFIEATIAEYDEVIKKEKITPEQFKQKVKQSLKKIPDCPTA